jgi:hypothetical protein
MRTHIIFLASFLLLILFGCEKENNVQNDDSSLKNSSEAHLYLKSSETIYSDENGNKYYTLTFNSDTLKHIYSVLFEKDKKYNLSITGDFCGAIDFLLLNSNKETLFYGEQGDIGLTRKYIVWQSDITDTFYISISYTEDINFHTYEYHITFEELTIHRLNWKGLVLDCSGDWFINADDYLTLAIHNSSYSKWAKIVDNSLLNFKLNFQVGLKSGIPDIYTGIAFNASDNLFEMVNLPDKCYEFKIIGPSSWEQWTWNNGVGREWGETSNSLNRGEGAWNEMQVETLDDSIKLSVNTERVKSFKNLYFMDNGLYLAVDDQKEDTIYFRDIKLIK